MQQEVDFFVQAIRKEELLTSSQICVYTALLVCWHDCQFAEPFRISRSRIMKLARVHSKTTYHSCIKALQKNGLIRYEPSYQPKGSWVWMRRGI